MVLVVLILNLGPRLYFWHSDGSTMLLSDGMGGWDGKSKQGEETEDDLDDDHYYSSGNFL